MGNICNAKRWIDRYEWERWGGARRDVQNVPNWDLPGSTCVAVEVRSECVRVKTCVWCWIVVLDHERCGGFDCGSLIVEKGIFKYVGDSDL